MTAVKLITGWSEQTAGAVTGRHVLAIQATTAMAGAGGRGDGHRW